MRLTSHEALKHLLREGPSFRDFLKDPLVNQIKKLRHHGEGGDIALLQSPQKLGRVQSLQIHNARAFHQRQQQIGHLCQHVKHGQHAQQRVRRPEVDPVKYSFHFAQESWRG